MNRPYIKQETIREINIKELEKKKAKLRKEKDLILEQQRLVFPNQQTAQMVQMLANKEEIEEENDMGMSL
ncbi:MAG: hypothetical protein IJ105_02870 [Bacilli bacterium]|nr:hypothetical protein [Bacilli bacterium]